ncbi:SRPBCC domain-containing protein [Paraherbaspirillum soli]|uniref:SRPBCC domain-containing protein n=1 Tax=Paraherbaspirillum soli TaxID=631222 RepID=A0ABW0MCS7_9BURK
MPKNIILAASFAATAPEKLYDMYLDPVAHAAFTGAPVTIAAHPGAAFSAFDGELSGTMLHVEPKRLIVQTWRSAHWAGEAIDSVLVLTFWPQGDGARIELMHINVPDDDFAGVSRGWEQYYWTPWRAYLDHDPPLP